MTSFISEIIISHFYSRVISYRTLPGDILYGPEYNFIEILRIYYENDEYAKYLKEFLNLSLKFSLFIKGLDGKLDRCIFYSHISIEKEDEKEKNFVIKLEDFIIYDTEKQVGIIQKAFESFKFIGKLYEECKS